MYGTNNGLLCMLSSLLLDLEQSHGRVTDTTHIANPVHNFNSTMTAVFSRTFREKISFQVQCLKSSRRVAR
ncbi:hypothetical protein JB92DRAFT_2888232 [Gautieria morchelliformis]|nr:hypothetical protein JB92DRAFT_2888232 [Gautieria morchelliformis]